MSNKAAKRYAKAFFELASNRIEDANQDMILVRKTIQNSSELKKVLSNPTINASKKLNIVKTIFENKISDLATKLVQLLGEKDRLSLLEQVAISFEELYKKSKKIREASVVSAVPLNKELETAIFNKIKELTGSNEVSLKNIVDSSIIGGFILNINDLKYDASISGKLAKIKSKLVE